MAGLFGGGAPRMEMPAPPPPPPPPPQVDDAVQRMNENDRGARRQGRRTTLFTSESGLPDLGTTTRAGM